MFISLHYRTPRKWSLGKMDTVYGATIDNLAAQFVTGTGNIKLDIGTYNISLQGAAADDFNSTPTPGPVLEVFSTIDEGETAGTLTMKYGSTASKLEQLIIHGGTVRAKYGTVFKGANGVLSTSIVMNGGALHLETPTNDGSTNSQKGNLFGLTNRYAYLFNQTVQVALENGTVACITSDNRRDGTTAAVGIGIFNTNALTYTGVTGGTFTIDADITAWGTSAVSDRIFAIADSSRSTNGVEVLISGEIGHGTSHTDGQNITLVKTGTGTLQIGNVNHTPGLRIEEGTVIASHAQALGEDRELKNTVTVGSSSTSATLDLQAGNTNGISQLLGNANGVITNTGATATTLKVGKAGVELDSEYSGAITGNLGLEVAANTLTLKGDLTYTGGTKVVGGAKLVLDGSSLTSNGMGLAALTTATPVTLEGSGSGLALTKNTTTKTTTISGAGTISNAVLSIDNGATVQMDSGVNLNYIAVTLNGGTLSGNAAESLLSLGAYTSLSGHGQLNNLSLEGAVVNYGAIGGEGWTPAFSKAADGTLALTSMQINVSSVAAAGEYTLLSGVTADAALDLSAFSINGSSIDATGNFTAVHINGHMYDGSLSFADGNLKLTLALMPEILNWAPADGNHVWTNTQQDGWDNLDGNHAGAGDQAAAYVIFNSVKESDGSRTLVEISGDVTPKSVTVQAGSNLMFGVQEGGTGKITGDAYLTVNDNSTALTVAMANDFTGGTTVSAATLTAAAEGALGSGDILVKDRGTLVLDAAGALTTAGTRNLTLSGSGDTLVIKNSTGLGNTKLISTGGTVDVQADVSWSNAQLDLDAGTSLVNTSNSAKTVTYSGTGGTYSGSVGGNLNIVMDSAGNTQVFNGDLSSFNGNVTVTQGSLTFANSGDTAASIDTLTVNSGAGTTTVGGKVGVTTLTMAGSKTLTLSNGATLTTTGIKMEANHEGQDGYIKAQSGNAVVINSDYVFQGMTLTLTAAGGETVFFAGLDNSDLVHDADGTTQLNLTWRTQRNIRNLTAKRGTLEFKKDAGATGSQGNTINISGVVTVDQGGKIQLDDEASILSIDSGVLKIAGQSTATTITTVVDGATVSGSSASAKVSNAAVTITNVNANTTYEWGAQLDNSSVNVTQGNLKLTNTNNQLSSLTASGDVTISGSTSVSGAVSIARHKLILDSNSSTTLGADSNMSVLVGGNGASLAINNKATVTVGNVWYVEYALNGLSGDGLLINNTSNAVTLGGGDRQINTINGNYEHAKSALTFTKNTTSGPTTINGSVTAGNSVTVQGGTTLNVSESGSLNVTGSGALTVTGASTTLTDAGTITATKDVLVTAGANLSVADGGALNVEGTGVLKLGGNGVLNAEGTVNAKNGVTFTDATGVINVKGDNVTVGSETATSSVEIKGDGANGRVNITAGKTLHLDNASASHVAFDVIAAPVTIDDTEVGVPATRGIIDITAGAAMYNATEAQSYVGIVQDAGPGNLQALMSDCTLQNSDVVVSAAGATDAAALAMGVENFYGKEFTLNILSGVSVDASSTLGLIGMGNYSNIVLHWSVRGEATEPALLSSSEDGAPPANYQEYTGGKVNIATMTGVNHGQVVDVWATYSVPEPATGVLSVLALAGLAARRRRK